MYCFPTREKGPPPHGLFEHNMRLIPTKVDDWYHSGELFSPHMLFGASSGVLFGLMINGGLFV